MRQQPVACEPFFVSGVLVVPQPVSIYILNWLTSWSIQFNSRSYVSLPGEMTSVFSHFKSRCWSEKLKVSSRVSKSCQENTPKCLGRIISRKVSVHRTINAKHPACEVQCLLLRAFLSPMAECMTSNYASAQSVASTKEKQWEVRWRFPLLWGVRCRLHSIGT